MNPAYDERDYPETIEDEPTLSLDKTALAIRSNIAKVESAMSEFDKITAGLAALAERHPPDLVFDVSTGKGMAEAIAHRAAWRDPRILVEKHRKLAKAPILALGKDIDARAAWLTAKLLEGEVPVDQQIQAELTRREAEKQARINAEFGRVQAIQDALAEIHMEVMAVASKPSAEIEAKLAELEARTLDPLVFPEQLAQAEAARRAGVEKLKTAAAAMRFHEAEAAKLAAEREELAQLRAAAAAQKAKDAAAAEELRKAQAAQAAAERAALALERAELERQQKEMAAAMRAAAAADAPVATQATAEPEQPASEAEKPLYAPLRDSGWCAKGMGVRIDQAPKRVITVELDDTPPAEIPPAPPAPTLKLGDLQARLAPVLVIASGLSALGFEPAGSAGAAKLYHESQFNAICDAISAHVLAKKGA